MSTISILIEGEISGARLIALKNITGQALSEIRATLASTKPVFEREIFDSEFDDHAAQIRTLLDFIETEELLHQIYELPEGETLSSCDEPSIHHIPIQTLKNILDNA